jgi:hypothetical protein
MWGHLLKISTDEARYRAINYLDENLDWAVECVGEHLKKKRQTSTALLAVQEYTHLHMTHQWLCDLLLMMAMARFLRKHVVILAKGKMWGTAVRGEGQSDEDYVAKADFLWFAGEDALYYPGYRKPERLLAHDHDRNREWYRPLFQPDDTGVLDMSFESMRKCVYSVCERLGMPEQREEFENAFPEAGDRVNSLGLGMLPNAEVPQGAAEVEGVNELTGDVHEGGLIGESDASGHAVLREEGDGRSPNSTGRVQEEVADEHVRPNNDPKPAAARASAVTGKGRSVRVRSNRQKAGPSQKRKDQAAGSGGATTRSKGKVEVAALPTLKEEQIRGKGRRPSCPAKGKHGYKCHLCGYYASCKSHWKQHQVVHYPAKKVKCPDCRMRFSQQSDMVRHNTEKHQTDLWFSCHKCTYKSKNSKVLKSHVRAHDRVIECPFCVYRNNNKSNMNRHVRGKHPERMEL